MAEPLESTLKKRISDDRRNSANYLDLAYLFAATHRGDAAERVLVDAMSAAEPNIEVCRQLATMHMYRNAFSQADAVITTWKSFDNSWRPRQQEAMLRTSEAAQLAQAAPATARAKIEQALAAANEAISYLGADDEPIAGYGVKVFALTMKADLGFLTDPAEQRVVHDDLASIRSILEVAHRNDVALPRFIDRVIPTYPEEARQAHIQSGVAVRVLIDESGRVASANVGVDPLPPMLQRAAIEAARQWRFEPTIVNGVPRRVWSAIVFDFTLKPSGR